MRSIRCSILFYCVGIWLGSCSQDGDENDGQDPDKGQDDFYAVGEDSLLHGKVDGYAWEFGSGSVSRIQTDGDEQEYRIVLTEEKLMDPCDHWSEGRISYPRQVIFRTRTEEGAYRFREQNSAQVIRGVTFSYFDDRSREYVNSLTDDGGYEINTVTEIKLEGVLHTKFDSENHVNGKFIAIFCDANFR